MGRRGVCRLKNIEIKGVRDLERREIGEKVGYMGRDSERLGVGVGAAFWEEGS